MLMLTNAGTDKLQVVTSAAVTVDVSAHWIDRNTSTFEQVLGRTNTAISTATTTDVVATPAATTVRIVKTLHIRNKHASLSVDVTVVYDANGTDFELHKTTLRAGETLEYVEGIGFFAITLPTNPALRTAALAADQSNSTTTPTEVAGISLTTGTGVFRFLYWILYQAAAATTGVRFSVNHTGTTTAFVYNRRFPAGTTASADTPDQDSTAAVILSAFTARAKSTTGLGTTTTVDTANADMLEIIEGLMIVTVDGDIELWHGSEVAAQSTVKAGTSLELVRLGD